MVLRYSSKPSQRQLKVSQILRAAISDVFARGELSHPYFDSIMITTSEVRISADLKNATAFLVLPTDSDKKGLIKFFNDISPQIKKLISSKVNLRYMPNIRFVSDESADNAKRIDDLLDNL